MNINEQTLYCNLNLLTKFITPNDSHDEHQSKSLLMEVDMGAAVFLISTELYKNTWPEQQRPELCPSSRTYMREELDVQGCLTVRVHYNQQTNSLPLLVVTGHGTSLLG